MIEYEKKKEEFEKNFTSVIEQAVINLYSGNYWDVNGYVKKQLQCSM